MLLQSDILLLLKTNEYITLLPVEISEGSGPGFVYFVYIRVSFEKDNKDLNRDLITQRSRPCLQIISVIYHNEI
jgi:hypothetical protein